MSMAAFGGMVAGSVAGCGGDKKTDAAKPDGKNAPADKSTPVETASADVSDVHVCHGLNSCKGKGSDGKNECAGQGTCATKSTHHSCAGENVCKGQGGCGDTAGANDCKTKGGCHVPLMEEAWKGARKRFEDKMTEAKKEFGKDPGKPKAAS